MSDQDLALCDAMAMAELPCLPPIDEGEFAEYLRRLQASLPRRAADRVGGEVAFDTYQRMLGHLSRPQVRFLVREALATCKWFPTIAECLEIVGGWKREDARRKALAADRASRERQARFEDAMSGLKAGSVTQAEVDAWPERWRKVAETRGLLRLINEAYRVRIVNEARDIAA